MQAAQFYTKEKLLVEDVPIPQLNPNQVLVRIKFCGICGTDLHEYTHGPILTLACPHPQFGHSLPITFGHEASGVVEKVGPEVQDYKPGDRVIIEPIKTCRECEECTSGHYNLCKKAGFLGCMGNGLLAQYAAVDDSMLHHLPDNVSFEAGAIAEPACVAFHAIQMAGISKGHTILVLGCGPIGALVLKALSTVDTAWVATAEPSPLRAANAKRLGAHDVFDPTKEDVVQKCLERTNGRGVDFVIDCAGFEPALDTAMDSVRMRGTIINLATWVNKPRVDLLKLLMGEKIYMGAQAYCGEHKQVLQLLKDGKLELEDLITAKIPLKDVVDKGIMALLNEKEKHVKILVDCT